MPRPDGEGHRQTATRQFGSATLPWMSFCSNPACRIEFVPKHGSTGKFCSLSCSATVTNRNRTRARKSGVYACLWCGAPVQAGRKFCSPSHVGAHRSRLAAIARAEREARGEPVRYDYNENRRLRRERCLAYLGGKCVACGATENLHFHHVDPSQKSFVVSDGLLFRWDRLVTELDKCELRCRGCHTDTHRSTSPCGTVQRYAVGCRCDLCKAAGAEYNRTHRAKKRSLSANTITAAWPSG